MKEEALNASYKKGKLWSVPEVSSERSPDEAQRNPGFKLGSKALSRMIYEDQSG